MKNLVKWLLITSVLFIVPSGCYEDNVLNPIDEEVVLELPDIIVNTIISGKVVDREGEILLDYQLSINGDIFDITTPFFLLELDRVKKRGQTIYVFKDDQLIGLGTFLLKENDNNRIEITAFPEISAQVFGQEIILNDQWTCRIQNNSFQDDLGNEAMVSEVEFMTFINYQKLTQVGYTKEGKVQSITPLGGFYIEFKAQDGSNLSPNEATVQLEANQLPALANGLFYFDMDKEIWIHIEQVNEGSTSFMVNQGGYFVYTYQTDGVFTEGEVLFDEIKLPFMEISWEIQEGLSFSTTTTQNGHWLAVVKENASNQAVFLNACKDVEILDPIEVSNMDFEQFQFTLNQEPKVSYVKSTVVDCNGSSVVGPTSIYVSQDGQIEPFYIQEGESGVYIPYCTSSEIVAFPGSQGFIYDPMDTIDVGFLSKCEAFSEGFSFLKIREDVMLFDAFNVSIKEDRIEVVSDDNSYRLIIRGVEDKVYNGEEVNIAINDPLFGNVGYFIQCENSPVGCGIDQCKVQFGTDNEGNQLVKIDFSGTLWMQSLSPAVAGNFEVEGTIFTHL